MSRSKALDNVMVALESAADSHCNMIAVLEEDITYVLKELETHEA